MNKRILVTTIFCLSLLAPLSGAISADVSRLAGEALAAGAWQATTTTNAPSARRWHTAVWAGSQMIVWGGYGSGGVYLNDGKRYNPATNTWSNVSGVNAPSGRCRHTAVWTPSEMIVWGGEGSGGSYLNDGKRYNPAADTWSNISASNAPSARYHHTAVWTGSEMIVWGG